VLGANQRWNVVGTGVNGSSLIVIGAITGRAIYEGTLDFAVAQAEADRLNGEG